MNATTADGWRFQWNCRSGGSCRSTMWRPCRESCRRRRQSSIEWQAPNAFQMNTSFHSVRSPRVNGAQTEHTNDPLLQYFCRRTATKIRPSLELLARGDDYGSIAALLRNLPNHLLDLRDRGFVGYLQACYGIFGRAFHRIPVARSNRMEVYVGQPVTRAVHEIDRPPVFKVVSSSAPD